VSRLTTRLAELRRHGRKALVSFITAGDPVPDATVPALIALVKGGADVLEVGVPFSDPEAEGPAIQASSERALANGTRLFDVLAMVREFRDVDDETPVILMGYLNSIERMGYQTFASCACEAGVDGVILVNLPPEEATELKSALEKLDIDLIFLVAPTTTLDRARRIVASASGFVYYVSLKGVTGADHIAVDSVLERVKALRAVTALPIMVGFGIKDGAAAHALSREADGVVIGSALVNTMGALAAEPARIPDALTARIGDLRRAIDAR
jgi:tryptophan synthase alpha chain